MGKISKQSPYNESLFFAIEQIAKYIQDDYIAKYSDVITHDEFRTLDIITYNPDVCQRDLAKLALRDSVRIGRILDKLEKKGLVERFNDTKGKRLVKKMKLTQKGEEIYLSTLNLIEPSTEKLLKDTFSSTQIEKLSLSLKKLHNAISQNTTIKI